MNGAGTNLCRAQGWNLEIQTSAKGNDENFEIQPQIWPLDDIMRITR